MSEGKKMNYSIVITPLSDEDGGGFVAAFPDLVGCMSDGATPEEAVANALDAFKEWMQTAENRKDFRIPEPGAARKRMEAARKEVLDNITALTNDYHALDGKIEDIEAKVEFIQEQLEHQESWGRFTEIAVDLGSQRDSMTILVPRR
ncbi:MAG: type II toxin-antitoxin system HicB family antitoxin [Parvibaculaceae bacterium]